MDTSLLTSLSPGLKLATTRKKFYSKYLCKLTVYVPGCRVIDDVDHKVSVAQALANRKKWKEANKQTISYWQQRYYQNLELADQEVLEWIKYIIDNKKDMMVRREDPHANIYFNNMQEMHNVSMLLSVGKRINFELLHVPDKDLIDSLNNNVIFVKNAPKYRYKVNLRDGKYSYEMRTTILQYLKNVDGIMLPVSFNNIMERSEQKAVSCWGLNFFINDLSILTFLGLIAPNRIRSVHELQQL